MTMRMHSGLALLILALTAFIGLTIPTAGFAADPLVTLDRGKDIFRFDTFGDQAYWGDSLRLHEAIAGEEFGGVGPGLSPNAALAVGLKVDLDALPLAVRAGIRRGNIDLNSPAVTLTLLKLNAVIGVTGFFTPSGHLRSVGIQCALCHSTVDDALAPGIGHRLDGWAAQDLNIGAIIALAPNLAPLAEALQVDIATVRTVLNSWGPGKFDAELILDGKAFGPDERSGATLIPPVFGLAGVNLHTWTGWGSVPHWNAFVAVLEMHGQGNFFDPRLNNSEQFPLAAAQNLGNVRVERDFVTPKLPALQLYQLSLAAPRAPVGSFDAASAERGRALFNGKADCARCHVSPIYTEPGWNMHTPEEVNLDDFQANRSPDKRYRTTPLKGLWTHTKRGFFHDGRFATLQEVLDFLNASFDLELTVPEKNDIIEFLKSI